MDEKHSFLNNGSGDDPLYATAKQVVIGAQKASISHLQRRLTIGYNRAARFIEQMEFDGVVSAPSYKGDRTVLAKEPA